MRCRSRGKEPDIPSPRQGDSKPATPSGRGRSQHETCPPGGGWSAPTDELPRARAIRRAPARSRSSVLGVWGDRAKTTRWKLQSNPIRVQREGDLPWHCSVAWRRAAGATIDRQRREACRSEAAPAGQTAIVSPARKSVFLLPHNYFFPRRACARQTSDRPGEIYSRETRSRARAFSWDRGLLGSIARTCSARRIAAR
jgi:hypothetical protein